ncbi:MAG: YjbQ family protein [Atopobiaceae bacterium]|jgi:thiamine phosphate synthase YjbQ (UPF0047 family)|nr:YjbQ family protein [Atopobiaceae bacterium]
MTTYREMISVHSHGKRTSYINITDQVKEIVKKSGIQTGICAVISPHTTCAVFFEEYCHDTDKNGDEFLQVDLNNALSKIIPDHTSSETFNYPGPKHYAAVATWPDAASYLPNGPQDLWNGDAHLRATIIGSSKVFDVSNSNLGVGKTGYIYFVDFDRTRSRQRHCIISVLGD